MYDSALLMQGIGLVEKQNINVIANNMQKYISFSLGNKHLPTLRFIDSFQFMAASLDTLVNNLASAGKENFRCVQMHFPVDKLDVLLRKGVFPYDFLENEACFSKTELPPPEQFFNQLTQESVSDADYAHAKLVWETFQMNTFGEYHDLYVCLDTLLLADVFENFRKLCMESYKLDPAHFFTLPGLGWEACLLKTGVELELITDPDQYLFLEQGIRGGISMISHRYSRANNPYIEGYDPSLPTKYIQYIDCNNLYPTSMCEHLPVGEFKWVEDVDSLDVTAVADDAHTGYILEVDLSYDSSLHSSHSDYPLAPENIIIREEMLSPFSKDLLKALGLKHFDALKKLTPNLLDKKHYVLHYRNLKYYLSLGLKLDKIHRALQFKQTNWMVPYIDFNTQKRKLAKNSFEKDLYKLLNNSVFGKSMEDVRKRIDIRLVQTPRRLQKLVAKPTYKSARIFTEDLAGVEMRKTTLKMNKPIYLGMTILDLSKLIMYKHHYDFVLPQYGDKVKLLFTDTDSFCYEVHTEDMYADMLANIDMYDTSDYPETHFLFSNKNKKVLGKFKNEVSGGHISEFVGLRPKCYSMTTTIGDKKTAKGVTRSTTKRDLGHDKYLSCLRNSQIVMADMRRIQNKDHQLFTMSCRKIGLSPTDDKRYLLADGISTLAHGHFKIQQ